MKLGYRIGRSVIWLLLGVLSLTLNGTINGLSVYFGVAALIAAGLTMIYVFIHFDKNMDEKVLMEMVMDAFSGLIIFTFPYSDNRFFTVVFSFWIAVMGLMMLLAGLTDKKNKELLWFFVLLGISFIISGFSIMHVTETTQNMLNYFIGFMLIIYAGSHFWLLIKLKREIY